MTHADFMHRCLELAVLGRKFVGNGALVGSVLVRDGRIVADGFHEAYGKCHAERQLLEKFDQKIRSTDVLYVNMEPCCHTGKTPPCTDIILERGIKHVVFGMQDPDIRVAGKGIEILRGNGVTVVGPILRASSEWLNRGLISVRTKMRPWITVKSARTIDGYIARKDGSPLLITDDEQNGWSHLHLRSAHDAILVGVQTIINDDPRLNTRLAKNDYQPWRIILDPHLRIPKGARVLTDEHAASTIVLTTEEKMSDSSSFTKDGTIILPVALSGNSFDWDALWKTLLTSHGVFNGLTSILVEGGERTWQSFKEAKMVDMEVSLVGKK
jgi:diaminohydroxyphosphoribosylaminopyrimidine deaminase/5-amino-6-(5-phosphoribosylamino)uracil reductase